MAHLAFCNVCGKGRSLPESGASHRQALDLLANIRLDWKGLLGSMTLPYYKHSLINTTVKILITLGPGMGVAGGGFGTEKEKKEIFIKKHCFSIFTNYS